MDAAHESKEVEEKNTIFKIKVPIKKYKYLATVANVEVDEEDRMNIEEGSRT